MGMEAFWKTVFQYCCKTSVKMTFQNSPETIKKIFSCKKIQLKL